VGNLYTRFVEVDSGYDFRNGRKISIRREEGSPTSRRNLNLFESQGLLQRERAPLATLLGRSRTSRTRTN